MGTVYAVFDERLDRKIAVKLIRSDGSGNDEAQQQMLPEARALARLSHPNVVHVYEVGEIEGQLFVAMACLAGPTLQGWLERSKPSRQEVLAVYRQAGEGLVAAHAEGIIHRDFKPNNVMFGADRRVRVLDFGLARLAELERASPIELAAPAAPATHGVDAALTLSGTVLGTPAYMSPEQFAGAPADARSDQFGFCVALYEALYGKRPFAGRSLAQLVSAVAEGRVDDPPSGSTVPGWLRKVVLRGLEPEPGRRFESMRDLLDALADDPAVRRRKIWAAGVAVLIMGGGAWWVNDALRADAQYCKHAADKLEGAWDAGRRAALEQAILHTELAYAPSTWVRIEAHLDAYADAWVAARVDACEATQQGEQSGELLDLRMACLDERREPLRVTVDELTRADAVTVEKSVEVVLALPALERCADLDALTTGAPLPDDPVLAERVAALDEQLTEAKVNARRRGTTRRSRSRTRWSPKPKPWATSHCWPAHGCCRGCCRTKSRDRPRARELAQLAASSYAEAGEQSARDLDEVKAWLNEHPE